MVERPSSRKTTSAAARAASEAPSTAIPQSARLREGASLTPKEIIKVSRDIPADEATSTLTISSHGSKMATLLQHLDDLVLVFGENFTESIGGLDEVVDIATRHATTRDEALGVVDVGSHTELLAGFDSDGDGVTSKHLDLDTEVTGFVDGGSSVASGRVEHGEETEELPLAVFLKSNSERSESTLGELEGLLAVNFGGLLVGLAESEDTIPRGELASRRPLQAERLATYALGAPLAAV